MLSEIYITDFISYITPAFEQLGFWGYWVAMLIAFLESLLVIGLVIPGAIIVPFLGFLAAQGILDIGDLIWITAIGSILGDTVSFYIGTKGGTFFHDKNLLFKEIHIKKAEDFFESHGSKSIFLGKFIGPLRAFIPFIAGLSKMDKKKFIFFDIISSFTWSASYLILGYIFGNSIHSIQTWSTRVILIILSLIIIIGIIYNLKVLIYKNGKELIRIIKALSISIYEAISQNSGLLNLIRNYPKLYRFLKNRFNKEKFEGLPLSFIGIIFIYIFAVLIGLTENILSSDRMVNVDLQVLDFVEKLRMEVFTKIFLWITLLGNVEVILFTGTIISIILLLIFRKKLFILFLWLNIILSGIFSFFSKIIIERPRPENGIYLENTFSFPSGHSIVAIVFYGAITYIFIRTSKVWKRKVNGFFLFLSVFMLIGMSRIYLSVHYLSDVIGGYLIGILILLSTIAIFEHYEYKKNLKIEWKKLSIRTKIIIAILILANILFYIKFALTWPPLNML